MRTAGFELLARDPPLAFLQSFLSQVGNFLQERECRYYIIRVVVEVLGEVEETSGERSVLEESEALMCCSFLGIDAMQAYAKSGGQLCVAGSAPDTRNTAEEEEKEEQEEKAEEYLCHPVQTIVRTPDSFPTYCAEVLPNRYYLKHCYVAASRLGDDGVVPFQTYFAC